MSKQMSLPTMSPIERLQNIAGGYVASSAVNAIVRLNIADLVGDGESDVSTLAKQTQTNEDALYRVLRLLSSMEIFSEVRDRVFANNASSNLLRSDVDGTQRAMVEFISDPFHLRMYADMVPTIKDGRTAPEHVLNQKCFDFFESDPDEQRRFDDAMTSMSLRTAPVVVKSYDFSGIETLVDVAGGHAVLLTSILKEYPNMKGVLFDLPHVVKGAEKRIAELGLSSRCATVGGDFFKSVPAGDAYIMKHIIHDWDDEHAITILKNCHAAMSKSGARKLLLVEMILGERNEMHPSKFLDIEMLMLPGGRERTEAEYASLFQKSGFSLAHVVRTQSPHCIIEAMPV
jgi:hypothetical protein